jgi:hypothetical protein
MKKILMTFVMAGICSVAFSQAPVKQNIKLLVDQIPLLVRQAYEKDFGVLPTEGWSAQVETTPDGNRTATKPLYYAYSKKEGGKKVEIRFSPTGQVTSVKGIENPNHQTKDSSSTTSDGM